MKYSPVPAAGRFQSVDVLRGIAVLGILIMNIQSFSMIAAAYENPTAYGDLTGINFWIWAISYTLADSKFMAIFSMLYGAGIVLMADRITEKGGNPATLFYTRSFWLLLFGIIHAFIIWYGDILTAYALVGMLAFLFRKKSVKTLLGTGIALLMIPFLFSLFAQYTLDLWPPESIQESANRWMPGEEAVTSEILAMRGSWLEQMQVRGPLAFVMNTMVLFIYTLWRVGGMMLIGMAFYKAGYLTLNRSNAYYRGLFFFGILFGLSLIIFGVWYNISANFDWTNSMFFGKLFNYFGSIFLAFAYIAVVMLFVRSGILKKIRAMLASVGRMAFTNYIMQSIICTLIYYGHGFGQFGRMERWQQAIVMVSIWMVQMIYSYLWLKKYKMGPLEWLWRSLTYRKIQTLKKDA